VIRIEVFLYERKVIKMELYEKIHPEGWKDYPDTTTPVEGDKLTHIEEGIYENSVNIKNVDNVTKYITATAGADGDFWIDIENDLVAGMVLYISFPAATNPASNARLSIDNGVSYVNILNTLGSGVQNKQIELKYNGTQYEIINTQSSSFFKLTSTQSLTNSVFTTILYGTKNVLQGADLVDISSGVFTIKEKGLYLILLNTVFDTNASGARYQDVRFNNSSYGLSTGAGFSGLRTSLSSFAIINFNENDTFFCRAYQTSGGALSLITDSSVSIIRLS
jgi:hypothetical protein